MTDNPAIEAMGDAFLDTLVSDPVLGMVNLNEALQAALTAYHEHLAAAQRDNLTTLQTHLNLGTFDRYPNVEKAIAAMIAAGHNDPRSLAIEVLAATPPTT